MILKILLVLVYLIEIAFLPPFIIRMWPKQNNRSLLYKMILATMFVSCAILCSKIADNNGIYARTMITAFCFSFVGDFFLHVNFGDWAFITGAVSFAVSHGFFTAAYIKEIKILNPDAPIFYSYEFICAALMLVIIIVYNIIRKVPLGKFAVLCYAYGAVLSLMLMKAVTFAKTLFTSSVSGNGVLGGVLVLAGAFLFFTSDVTILYTIFDERRKHNYPYKIYNTLSYFIAQMLLATSLIAVK